MADKENAAAMPPQNAWLQAGGLAFLALYAVAILAALSWLISNCREVRPEERAVVVRLGALYRVQNAGLLVAWPRPFEQVLTLPSSETVLEQDMQVAPSSGTARSSSQANTGEEDSSAAPSGISDAEAAIDNRLTGDSGVVRMDVKVFYTVIDPFEYLIEKDHLAPALDRLVSRSVVLACASRDLDAILVARPELLGSAHELAEQRERLRGDVMQLINHELSQLHNARAGLGIELKRIDLIASLHPETVDAFESVLTASQEVLQSIADARTESARTLQSANEESDRTIETARANASERISNAQADTADVTQLAQAMKTGSDGGLLSRIYRERIRSVLTRTSSLTLVNPDDDTHLIIQGADK